MEFTFSKLRAKEVINTQDGRKLGKICDIVLCYPDNKWVGIIVPAGRGFSIKKTELFIDLKRIVKIGEDVILVNVGVPQRQCGKRKEGGYPPNGAPYPPGGMPYPPNGFGGVGGGSPRDFENFE